MHVSVLVLDSVFDTGLSTVLDAFQTANELAAMSGVSSSRFDVTLVGVRKSVKTSQGLTVPVRTVPKRAPDCVVVPALGFKMPDTLQRALARPDIRDATTVLQQWADRGATMSAACIGTFVLAESGLLDDRDATTTWWLAPLFRTRYPAVRLDESHMLVKSGKVVTAGAALSHMDLALWLIRQQSPKLAALTAKYLIVDARPSQSAYVLTDHLIHKRPAGRTIRTVGPHSTRARLLTGRGGESRRLEQAHARAPSARGAGKVASVVLSESAGRTRRAPAQDRHRERRSDCRTSGLRRWRHAADAPATSPGPRRQRNPPGELIGVRDAP
jgi:putative intracellular protease/amidase